jgi:hypothetical protein
MFKFNRSTVTEVLHVICIQNLNECLSSIDLVTEVLHVICIQFLIGGTIHQALQL